MRGAGIGKTCLIMNVNVFLNMNQRNDLRLF
jgi:hypothetical protein